MHHNVKKVTLAVTAALLSGTALAGTQIPLTVEDAMRVAAADQHNSVAVGARATQTNGSETTFNAWNGAYDSSASADVDMNIRGGDAANQWTIEGRDVGTEIPEVRMGFDRVGTFGVEAGYQRFRHFSKDDAHFYATDGTDIGHKDIDQIRDVYRIGGYWSATDNLDVRAAYQLDDRRGSNLVSLAQGIYGSTFNTAGEIDDQHHQVDVSTEWNFNAISLEASYYLSKYDNNQPVIKRSLNGSSYGLAVDPSNTLHRIGLDGLWQISDTSTLSVSAGYSWNKLEDDTFEAVSFDYANTLINDPNYDAETKIPTFDIAYTAHPWEDLSVSAKYGYRKVDNSVDSHGFSYETGVSWPSQASYSFKDMSRTEHKLAADAIYNLGQGYSVKAWGAMLDKSYENTIEGNTEWKAGLELRKRMSSTLSGKVSYQFTDRTAEDWRVTEGNLANDSYWSLAAYTEHELKLDLNTSLTDALMLGFSTSVYTRDYGDTEGSDGRFYGVDEAKGFRLGLDGDWTISRDWSIFAFYEFDYQKFGNNTEGLTALEDDGNHQFATTVLKDNKDMTHTFGLGVDLHPELKPWALKLQYVYSFDKTKTSADTGKSPDYPDVEYKSHYAEATGSWRFNNVWSLEGSVLYGKVDTNDYLRASEYINNSHTGYAINPLDDANYSAALFYLGVKYNLPM